MFLVIGIRRLRFCHAEPNYCLSELGQPSPATNCSPGGFAATSPMLVPFQRKGGLFHPPVNAKYQCFIILGVQSVSLQHFACSRYSLAGLSLPFLGSCMNFFCFQSFKREILPHSLYVLVSPPAFSITCHDAPSPPRLRTTAISSKVHLHSLPTFHCSVAGTSWRCGLLTILYHY